jgi:hypothetical protein
VYHEGSYLQGNVQSVPLGDSDEYTIVFDDEPQPYTVSSHRVSGDGEPSFTLPELEPDEPVTNALPTVPEWIEDNTRITLYHEGRKRRGFLATTDRGWKFIQRTASGRTTFQLELYDLPVTWESRLTEGIIELGGQA